MGCCFQLLSVMVKSVRIAASAAGLASVGLCPESMPTVVVAPRLAAHDAEKRRRELLVVIGPDVEGRHGEDRVTLVRSR